MQHSHALTEAHSKTTGSVDLAPGVTPALYRHLVNEWLRSKRSTHTQTAYMRDIAEFFSFIQGPNRATSRTSLD